MTDPRTALRRRLGAQLRAIRKRAGLSGREVGDRAGISQSKVSRMENGQLWPPLADIAAWLQACYVDKREYDRVMALAEAIEQGTTTLRDLHRGSLEIRQREAAELERSAVAVRDFQPLIIPLPFQTPEYARALIDSTNLHGERDVTAAINARIKRGQRLWSAGAPAYHTIIMQSALRWRPAAAPNSLPAVWRSLLDSRRSPTITMQVIPDGVATAAVPTCGYTIHDFVRGPRLVIVQVPAAELTFAGAAETTDFLAVWERMRTAALPESASLDLIADLASDSA